LLNASRMSFSRALLATSILIVAAGPARAGGRLTALAAGRSQLYALADDTLVTFDVAGRPIGRCRHFAPPAAPTHVSGPGIGAPDPEQLLRAAGLPPNDLDSTAAEDLLDNEGLTAPRRRRAPPTEPAIELRALATPPGRDEVWIGSSAGLYRGGARGCVPVALAGHDLRLVAAASNLVAAASDDLLWRFDTLTSAVAGVTGLAARPRALAVAGDASTLVADEEGLIAVAPDGAVARLLQVAVDAVIACGESNAALAVDGVYVWANGARPVRVGARPPAGALACGPAASPRWLAAGIGLWRSTDGDDWQDDAGWRGLSISHAAALGPRVWLVASGMLVPADRVPSPPGRARSAPHALASLPTAPKVVPLLPLPLVSVVLAEQRRDTRIGWAALLLLTFPLGGRRLGLRSAAPERARLDAALAAEERDLFSAPLEDDERAALLAATRQEREALR
jgi:hypothetical protein